MFNNNPRYHTAHCFLSLSDVEADVILEGENKQDINNQIDKWLGENHSTAAVLVYNSTGKIVDRVSE